MRLVFFTNNYKPIVGGIITSISLFRHGLIAAGHDVHVFAPEYAGYEDQEPYVYRFPSVDLSDQLEASVVLPFKRLMAPTVRGIKPTLIHSQHPFVMGGVAADLAQDLRLPLVYTFHTRYDQYAQRYVPIVSDLAGTVTDEIVGRYLERCTHVIAPTRSIADLICRDHAPPVPVAVVPTPVDLDRYRPDRLRPARVQRELGLPGAEILLYIGRLAQEKNVRFLIQAFAGVVSARPQARLVLVGSGLQERVLRREVRQQGLEGLVRFAGQVAHEEVPHYVATATIFVFASLTDTQGLVMIEAMAAGTPVVAVEAPGTVDVLAQGGGVLTPADPDAFSAAILDLLADPDRRRALGRAGRRATARYSIPAATARLLGVYEAAVAAGPRPRRRSSAYSDLAPW